MEDRIIAGALLELAQKYMQRGNRAAATALIEHSSKFTQVSR